MELSTNYLVGAFVVALLVVCAVAPLLNLVVPRGSLFHMSDYTVALLGKIMCFAICALAMDLIWGYTGILSLGHGLFFALGGYMMGMYLMRQIGSRGVYANPILPDFMVFLNWKELPWYWYGFDMFWFAAIMVMLVPGLGYSALFVLFAGLSLASAVLLASFAREAGNPLAGDA